MSMNLHLWAYKNLKDEDGEELSVKKEFDCIQTPTSKSYEIINSKDIKQSYIKWLRDNCDDWCEEHIVDLERFLEEYSKWNIEWYVL